MPAAAAAGATARAEAAKANRAGCSIKHIQ
jgi:hypothetical protein